MSTFIKNPKTDKKLKTTKSAKKKSTNQNDLSIPILPFFSIPSFPSQITIQEPAPTALIPMIVTVPHAHCLPKGKTHGEKVCDLVAKDSATYFSESLSKFKNLFVVDLVIADQTRDPCEEEPCVLAQQPEVYCDLNRLRCNDRPFRQTVRKIYRQIPHHMLEK